MRGHHFFPRIALNFLTFKSFSIEVFEVAVVSSFLSVYFFSFFHWNNSSGVSYLIGFAGVSTVLGRHEIWYPLTDVQFYSERDLLWSLMVLIDIYM